MKKVQVTVSWDLSVDSSHVVNQIVKVGEAVQTLDNATNSFTFIEAENTDFSVAVTANTAKKTSPPLVISGKTPAVADIIEPVAPTNGNVVFEVVDV